MDKNLISYTTMHIVYAIVTCCRFHWGNHIYIHNRTEKLEMIGELDASREKIHTMLQSQHNLQRDNEKLRQMISAIDEEQGDEMVLDQLRKESAKKNRSLQAREDTEIGRMTDMVWRCPVNLLGIWQCLSGMSYFLPLWCDVHPVEHHFIYRIWVRDFAKSTHST